MDFRYNILRPEKLISSRLKLRTPRLGQSKLTKSCGDDLYYHGCPRKGLRPSKASHFAVCIGLGLTGPKGDQCNLARVSSTAFFSSCFDLSAFSGLGTIIWIRGVAVLIARCTGSGLSSRNNFAYADAIFAASV